jgi:AraC-like DNA-binding protein
MKEQTPNTCKKEIYKNNKGFYLTHICGSFKNNSLFDYLNADGSIVFMYFSKGIAEIKIEGKTFSLTEGDLIILKPNEIFQCELDSNCYQERIELHISPSVLDNFTFETSPYYANYFQLPSEYNFYLPAPVTHTKHILDDLCILMSYIKDQPDNQLLSLCKVMEFLVKITEILSENQSLGTLFKHENNTIKEVLQYINAHYRENISIPSIAEIFSIDPSYLSHLFKEEVGVSLWNYVIFRRINHFNELIKSKHSIENACFLSGFQNYSNFFRLYKKYMHMTPMKYKKLNQ